MAIVTCSCIYIYTSQCEVDFTHHEKKISYAVKCIFAMPYQTSNSIVSILIYITVNGSVPLSAHSYLSDGNHSQCNHVKVVNQKEVVPLGRTTSLFAARRELCSARTNPNSF